MRPGVALAALPTLVALGSAKPVNNLAWTRTTDHHMMKRCTLPTDDPKVAWSESKAGDYLNNYLDQNGSVNWFHKLDEDVKNKGKQSNLNCVNFPDNSFCTAPEGTCDQYDPPELWYIFNAGVTFHAVMAELFNSLSQEIANTVQPTAGRIWNDFAPIQQHPSSFPFGILIGSLVLASLLPEIGIPAGVGIGVANIATNMVKQEGTRNTDPQADVKEAIANIWAADRDLLTQYVEVIFGSPMTESIKDAFGTDNSVELIKGTFADGKWLLPSTIDSDGKGSINDVVEPIINKTVDFIEKRLVVASLNSNKAFIWVDHGQTADECNGITGARLINNECYIIGTIGPKPTRAIHSLQLPYEFELQWMRETVQWLDTDSLLKLESVYGFNVEGFYRNAQDCMNSGGGEVDQQNFILGEGSDLPRCFVNLPVIKATNSPCFDGNDWSSLGYTKDYCDWVH
ncbi:hypothetical protein BGZ63DRAFT_405070 [Mariannaea sp. PMI_226]|nr:hypothetical protein BGZ63DRAFT_405070 [Mariannaea sp. PMI_226]